MNIVLAGAAGFVGTPLIEALIARGDKVAVLTRRPEAVRARWAGRASIAEWDGKSAGPWEKALNGAEAVINLCGESVAAGRWTPERKLVLARSRLDSTRALVAAISRAPARPKTLINASAVGYYGSAPDGDRVETSPQGADFLAALCGQWEREAFAAEALGARVATLRLGVVLGKGGGALSKMTPPFRFFLGGPLGCGRQWFAWIHRDDVVGAVLFLLDHAEVSGPVNLVSPELKTNAEFSAALGRALGRPSWLPAPAFALRLALGEMSDMLLGGQRALPKKLLAAGYAFKYPNLDVALQTILS
ncbi:MAG: TIGR01777 family protein [Elusimicrobia bacterium]|nr:TIGR01777 family protein [Elusimicrobiota bacterium]